MMYPEIMTPEQAAEMLQIKTSHVQKLARNGGIPAKKVGHLWRFNREELRTWMRSGVHSQAEEETQ